MMKLVMFVICGTLAASTRTSGVELMQHRRSVEKILPGLDGVAPVAHGSLEGGVTGLAGGVNITIVITNNSILNGNTAGNMSMTLPGLEPLPGLSHFLEATTQVGVPVEKE
mmetsp:Transcript_91723/g.163251  ORF Transcript_91723/g.163251 Transcript_91723/m.163251 type:complete len:111 (+) Transcript_91723:90-422(+)